MAHPDSTDKDALVVDDKSTTKPHGDVLMPEAAKQDGLGVTASTLTDAADQQHSGPSTPTRPGVVQARPDSANTEQL